MRLSIVILSWVMSLLALVCVASAQQVTARFEAVFTRDVAGPKLLTVSNAGPATQGVAEFRSGSGRLLFQLELPSGSTKEIMLPASADGYPGLYTFRVGAQVFEADTNWGSREGSRRIAVVGDEGLLYQRLEATPALQDGSVSVYSAPIERAPTRLAIYNSFSSVWLGGGADRLRDDQVQAVQDFLMAGGTVVLLGGAQPGALRDPRWTPLVGKFGSPQNARARLVASLPPVRFAHLTQAGGLPGTPILNGYGSYLEVGAGRLILLTFSPVDDAFEQAGQSSRLVERVVSFTPREVSPNLFRTNSTFREVPGSGLETMGEDMGSDGLASFQPPSAGSLFQPVWLFALLIVPVALFVPRWIKRPQWSWVALPVGSIAVSAFVLTNQQPLSQLGLSRNLEAVIYTHEGLADGVGGGFSEIFLPRAGVFDLKMPKAEYAEMQSGQDFTTSDWEDVGGVVPKPVRARNLEFRSVRFQTRVPGAGKWLAVAREPGSSRIRVTNRSPYLITEIWTPGKTPRAINKGETIVMDLTNVAAKDRVILYRVRGAPIGPQIGEATENVVAILRLRSAK